jgi:mRNA interferase MazF
MGGFVSGEVVVVPFPFSDLSDKKRRPAYVVATLQGDDVILCMITSQRRPGDNYSIPITTADFTTGALQHPSYVRPNRLFTADTNIIVRSVGQLTEAKQAEIIQAIKDILDSSL